MDIEKELAALRARWPGQVFWVDADGDIVVGAVDDAVVWISMDAGSGWYCLARGHAIAGKHATAVTALEHWLSTHPLRPFFIVDGRPVAWPEETP